MHHFTLPGLLGLVLISGCYTAEDLTGSAPPPTTDTQDEAEDEETDPFADDDDATDHPGDDDDTSPEPEPVLDAAEITSSSLPTSLDCGASFLAEVEVRNLGTATWTRAGEYKLGGVDDEDPLREGDARIWLPEEASVAPNETYLFSFELVAPMVPGTYITDWRMVHEAVTWFGDTTSATVSVDCSEQTFVDPLTDGSLHDGFASKDVSGGSFSAAGWQTTGGFDQLLIELDTPITGDGTLEVDVTNFDPASQYSAPKHQIINLYTSDNGSQDVFASNEAWWNIRSGTGYGTGVKFLASPLGGDNRSEVRLIENAAWSPSDTYTWTITWDDEDVSVLLDGNVLTTLPFDGRVQPLQYIFLGKDNVYVGQVGPIYSNLRVTYQP
ncbi:MAG: NBR1-Ig-like domain-containing protein [Myxococcota bacterium]|nr:NBR1-Ig-like domain-containing protein [Myxococcota bacterium]